MKSKSVFLVLITFLIVTIILCFVLTACFFSSWSNVPIVQIFNNIPNTFLYLVGYGDPPQQDIVFRSLIAIIGIVSLSLLDAFLTVKLFWRTNVTISKHMSFWKTNNGDRFGSILIGNSGKAICKVCVSFIAYSPTGKCIGKTTEIMNPLLPSKKLWQVDIPIAPTEDNFFYRFLRSAYNENEVDHENTYKIYAMWSFVDSKTGQESIKTQEYTTNQFIYPFDHNGIALSWSHFKHPQTDANMNRFFVDWVMGTKYLIPIQDMVPINAEVISILRELLPGTDRQSIQLNLNFYNCDSNNMFFPFGMACLQYSPVSNWSFYYENDGYFEFTIFGGKEIKSIQVEIKNGDSDRKKIIDVCIPVTEEPVTHSIRLKDSAFSAEGFKNILEVDFTIFNQNMCRPISQVTIIDCNLVLDPIS